MSDQDGNTVETIDCATAEKRITTAFSILGNAELSGAEERALLAHLKTCPGDCKKRFDAAYEDASVLAGKLLSGCQGDTLDEQWEEIVRRSTL